MDLRPDAKVLYLPFSFFIFSFMYLLLAFTICIIHQSILRSTSSLLISY